MGVQKSKKSVSKKKIKKSKKKNKNISLFLNKENNTLYIRHYTFTLNIKNIKLF